VAYATQGLATIPGLHLVGTAPDKASVVSFVLDGHRPEEVGAALNGAGPAAIDGAALLRGGRRLIFLVGGPYQRSPQGAGARRRALVFRYASKG
jgi:hypothetical protein